MKNLVFVLAIICSLPAFSQINSTKSAITYQSYTNFPAFPLYGLDSSRFSSISVPVKNQPIVVVYFSPTCSHCQHQAEEITSHMKEFKDVKFLLVSSYALEEIKQFAETYGIGHFANITLAQDPNFSMGQFFEIKSLPGIYVYDKNGLYKNHFDTNVTAEMLLKALK